MTSSELVRRSPLEDKLAYADQLAQSGLLPAAYRRQPANVLYATEYGEMLGLAPLAAINGLHIIEGKPTASAGLVSSLVRNAGHRLRSGYDATKKVGWCEIVRHDDPEFTYRTEWNLDRAVAADLCEIRNGRPYARDKTGKAKPWERYPEAMLKARAITECARDACEEALNGVHYTPEELGADVNESGEPIRVTSQRVDQADAEPDTADAGTDWDKLIEQRSGNRNALLELWNRAKAEEPGNTELHDRIKAAGIAAAEAETAKPATDPSDVVDAEIVDDAPAPPASERRATQDQLTAIAAALSEHNVKEREHRLAVVSLLIGDRIASSKDLTVSEASHVIDTIKRLAEEGQFKDTIAAATAHPYPVTETQES